MALVDDSDLDTERHVLSVMNFLIEITEITVWEIILRKW